MLIRFLRWFAVYRATIAFVILTVAVGVSDFGYVHLQNERRHDTCVSRRRLYDGEVQLTEFFGQELQATPAQVATGLAHLRATLKERPKC